MAATSVPTAAGDVVSVRSGLGVGRESIPSGAWLARDCSRWHGAHEELCWAAAQLFSPVDPAGRGAGAAHTADTAPVPSAALRSTAYAGPAAGCGVGLNTTRPRPL